MVAALNTSTLSKTGPAGWGGSSGGGEAVFLGYGDEALAVAGVLGVENLGFCKNEAILRGVVSYSFILVQLDDVDEGAEGKVVLNLTGLLDSAELGDGPFELAGEALGVHAEVG